MPRHARLDVPGSVQHVICRGIERRQIFRDDTDREDFVARLGQVLTATGTACYAWALLPNHAHLLLRTSAIPLTTVMRRLLTGYAGGFNRRHNRHGYLFQNRFKSILCQEEPYLLELVRYIHLNPLRRSLVPDLVALDRYPWAGHSALMGRFVRPWQDIQIVLAQFGLRRRQARSAYRSFVAAGIPQGWRPELTGGGLVRSAGGWSALTACRRRGDRLHGDERILGESDFVEAALRAAGEAWERRIGLRRRGRDFNWLLQWVAELMGVSPAVVEMPSKTPVRVAARSVLCCFAVRELGLSERAVGARLGISQSGVSHAVHRGERLIRERGLAFPK
jgi:REP element-mobilizing transposase RayT